MFLNPKATVPIPVNNVTEPWFFSSLLHKRLLLAQAGFGLLFRFPGVSFVGASSPRAPGDAAWAGGCEQCPGLVLTLRQSLLMPLLLPAEHVLEWA